MLERLRIVDASRSIAGALCTRLFADHGAEVIWLEPPGGSPLRARGPRQAGLPDDEASQLAWHLGLSKLSVTIDLDDPLGTQEAQRLARTADLVVADDPGIADLMQETTRVCLIRPFAADGPWADWQADELIHQALGGAMFLTGEADREPLYGFGERAECSAGVAAYIAALAALHDSDSAPQRIDVFTHEVVASMMQNLTTMVEYCGIVSNRSTTGRPRAVIRCRDAWVSLFIMPGTWAGVCTALGAPGLAADHRFADFIELIKNWADACEQLRALVADRPADEFVAALTSAGSAAGRVYRPSELRTNPDLVARNFWNELSTAHGPRLALAPFARYDGHRPRQSAAPTPGEHTATLASDETRPQTALVDRRSLRELRVLDLTTAWAGPMATRILAGLGATVVKLEGPDKPDGWRPARRAADIWMLPNFEPGERPWDRGSWFNTQNQDKLSVVLDLRSDEGRLLAQDLAVTCDVVIANARPGSLARIGLDRESLQNRAPGIIVVELPAYGAGGPSAAHPGLGPTMEAAAGIADLIGYPDGPPLGSGPAYMDPIGALHGAAGVLTALVARQTTGIGTTVEVSQREAAMHWYGEWSLDAIATGTDRDRAGNSHPDHAPHGAYPCAGDDRWLAISVHDDAEWRRLAEIVGDPDLLAAPDLATAPGRRGARARLDAALARWTAEHDRWELADKLQSAGVHAAPVCDANDLIRDEDLRSLGFYARLEHPQAGTHEYPGLPFRPRTTPRRPAPCFGEHTRAVLGEWLGLDDNALDDLARRGITATEPRR